MKKDYLDTLNLEKSDKIEVEKGVCSICLKRLKDDRTVKGKYRLETPSKRKLKDWLDEKTKGFLVTQFYIKDDKRLVGLISTRVREDLLAVEINLAKLAPFNHPIHL